MSSGSGGMGLTTAELEEMSRRCRINIVKMTHRAAAGHPGGSLSAIDLIAALYGTQLRIDPDNADWDDRDRFIMSKGHASPAVYSMLYEIGYLSEDDLMGFRTFGSVCQGHVDMKWTRVWTSLLGASAWVYHSAWVVPSLQRWMAVRG